jgi:hypothetical protein
MPRKQKENPRPRAEEATSLDPRLTGTHRVKKSILTRLDRQAAAEKVSKNHLIEKALECYLDAKEEDELTKCSLGGARLVILDSVNDLYERSSL